MTKVCPLAYRYVAKSIKLRNPIANSAVNAVSGLYGSLHVVDFVIET